MRKETVLDLKKAKGKNRAIVYIDESEFYLLLFLSRTIAAAAQAPKGQTLIIEEKAGKEQCTV